MTRWTTSWEDRGQIPTFHQSATPRSSIGNLFCPSSSYLFHLQTAVKFAGATGPFLAHVWVARMAFIWMSEYTVHANTHISSLTIKYSLIVVVHLHKMHTAYLFWCCFNIQTTYFSSSCPLSKPIKPSTSSNKPLPFIKVIEIKSWSDTVVVRKGPEAPNLSNADWNQTAPLRPHLMNIPDCDYINTNTKALQPQTLLKETVWCLAAHRHRGLLCVQWWMGVYVSFTVDILSILIQLMCMWSFYT